MDFVWFKFSELNRC